MKAAQSGPTAQAHQEELREQAEACLAALRTVLLEPPAVRSAADLQQAEQDCAQRCDELLAAHPRKGALKTERNYFHHNRRRFSYAWARRLRLPIGSGPMESAIRRVINLRLKGPGIFWHEQNAEAMILIRAFYEAHRWDELQRCACRPPLEAIL